MSEPISQDEQPTFQPHPLYKGEHQTDKKPIVVDNGSGTPETIFPVRFHTDKPSDAEGKPRDQTIEAAAHMRYAATLPIPHLEKRQLPRKGTAIIVGGAPSIKKYLEEIRKLSQDKNNEIFAINWTHTWLIQNGIVPNNTVFFEIDAEPDTVLKQAHKDCTYYICCHCHPKTFDDLAEFKRVIWHTPPNSQIEREAADELWPNNEWQVGGGISTFTRTITVALYRGFRDFELFGCDSSYPMNSQSHVEGYETVMKDENDGLDMFAKDERTGEIRKFRTLGYLALQVEEFKLYCQANHGIFTLRVNGDEDSLLKYVHSTMFADQYEYL
jgi:uncharacterized Rossmann fold enzyme